VYVFVDRRNPGTGSSFHIEATRDTRETEPNDTPATAQAAVCGILGAIDPAAEADFYALGDLPIGSRIYAMADSSGAGPSSNNDMRVNNATDTLEYDNSDLTTPFGGSAPVIAGHLTAGGQRFLQVDRNGSAPTSTSDPYRLYSVVQPLGGETAETEPNDSLAAAGTSAHDYFSGALGGPGEVDVYRFEAGVGTPIFAALDGDPARGGPPALDAKLELLDAGGNPLVSVDDGAFSSTTTPGTGDLFALDPVAPAEGLVFRPPRSGTYYLRVSAPSTPAASTGGYLLSVSLGCTTGVAPSITDTALPDGQVAKPYSHTFTATNAQGTPHWSVIGGSLPAGLGLSDSGVLSGTPTTAGDSSFEVRVTDGRGVNFSRPFSLHIAATDTTRPIVSAFKVTNSAFAPVAAKRAAKRGTRFSFRLSEPATVRITVAQRLKGKRKGKRCVKPTRKLRKKRNCTRFVTRGTLRFAGKQGANSRAFGGRFKGKALQRGRYRATLVATDAAGNKSKKKTLTFRIVRP
jgi:hypothetical protein